jgi:hypothetical protein
VIRAFQGVLRAFQRVIRAFQGGIKAKGRVAIKLALRDSLGNLCFLW